MFRFTTLHIGISAILLQCCHALESLISMPTPNGAYTVGMNTTEFINHDLTQPFAPDVEPARLQLSVFYPVDDQEYTTVNYMPPEVARFEDIIHSMTSGLAAPNGTFEQLGLQLASTGAQIASADAGSGWPVLLFSPAQGTTRLFYNYLVSNIASHGYVVLSFDTPYDTDVVLFSDGSLALGNESIQETACDAVTAVNTRASQASFILDQLSDNVTLSSLIPGCADCLNLKQVGSFGHSLGGAMSTTLLEKDKRVVSAINYDGAIWGEVVQHGTSKAYMIMAATNQTISNMNTPDNPDSSWAAIWPKLTGDKFFAILNNSLHYTYSDFALVLQTLNITTDDATKEAEKITDLDGDQAIQTISAYTLAFFNQSLRAEDSDLLDGPSEDYPGITFDDYTSTSTNDSSSAIYLCSASTTSSSSSPSGTSSSVAPRFGIKSWNILLAVLLPVVYRFVTEAV